MNIKHKTTLTFTFSAAACALLSTGVFAQQLTIADGGKSTFSIVISAEAPQSVQNAAQELQKDIEIATGAKLSVQKDDEKAPQNIISLGNTQQAKSVALSSDKMADESFRVITKDGNLYILGPDTPNGGWTKNNGTSNGTANGVYTFLEDYLDVRWLMPGDLGRDIPRKSTFTLENIDYTFTPKFAGMRRLTHLTHYTNNAQRKSVEQWYERSRVGENTGATNWYYMHNWWKEINLGYGGNRTTEPNTDAVRKAYAEHPEWFAMDKNGKRPMPRNHYAKIETTNQDLVKFFADRAIKTFESSKRPVAFSLSPSDGGGYSLSPESQALYDPPPTSVRDEEVSEGSPSMSSLILKWYDDIARIVAKKYPDRMLTGFIYAAYLYPPQKVEAKLPSNFSPVIAPSFDYGYGLYRKDIQERFHSVMDDWADVVTGPWFYYDLPNHIGRQEAAAVGNANFPGQTGAIMPAAPDILNIIFPQLLKSHIDGTNIYGSISWSSGALKNYVLAKMIWDPTLDANEIQKEWLNRAYGPAGKDMLEFYHHLDQWYRDYGDKIDGKISYKLTLDMLKNIYAAHYPEMEEIFVKAEKQPMNEVQRARFQLIKNNLAVLQWRLRNLGYLPENQNSPFLLSDAQVNDLIVQDDPAFQHFPGATTSGTSATKRRISLPWSVQVSDSAKPSDKSTFSQWEKQGTAAKADLFLIHAAQDGDIQIDTQMVVRGAYFAGYQIRDEKGKLVNSGIFNNEKPIVIPAKAGQSYTLAVPQRKPVNYQLKVQNAAMASGNVEGKTLTLIPEKQAPVYVFYAPSEESVGAFGEGENVNIRKPYSAATLQAYLKSLVTRGKYKEARLLETFDTGWRFSPDPQDDGIERGILKSTFDDSKWAPISPLNWWQFQGFPDYHGTAWYRFKFQGHEIKKGEQARIYFGAVDGNATVYLNGKKVGEHLLKEDFTGWDKAFTARVERYLLPGENTLTVKVVSKNDTTASGIFKPVALYAGIAK